MGMHMNHLKRRSLSECFAQFEGDISFKTPRLMLNCVLSIAIHSLDRVAQ